MALNTNTLFANRYRLEKKVGQGGFSEVWKATDQDGIVVALKIGLNNDEGYKYATNRFSHEYSITIGVKNKNLLTPNHFDIWQDTPFLVMDYVEGESLNRLMEYEKFDENRVLNILKQISQALDYLHHLDIVHLDVKPENILFDRNFNRYLLTDFGISQKAGIQVPDISNGTYLTIAYAAPERYETSPNANPASDIFSLGATAYTLAAGKEPWNGKGCQNLKKSELLDIQIKNFSGFFNNLLRASFNHNPKKRPKAEDIFDEVLYHQNPEPIKKPDAYSMLISGYLRGSKTAFASPINSAETFASSINKVIKINLEKNSHYHSLFNYVKFENRSSHKYKYYPVHSAALDNDMHLLELLLDNGASIDCRDSLNNTALHITAYKGSHKAMEYLINMGSDTEAINNDGETAFTIASRKSDLYSMEILANVGTDIPSFFIHVERCPSNFKKNILTKKLLEYYDCIGRSGDNLKTNLKVVDFLIAKGADVTKNCMKEAFVSAIVMRDYDLIEPLLKNGLNPNFNDSNYKNYTPVHFYVSPIKHSDAEPRGKHKIIPILAEYGADINATDADSNTPLHIAIINGSPTYDIKSLINAGADLEAVNSEGKTPLHLARENERVEWVKILKDCIING